jgi:hypothetical protein
MSQLWFPELIAVLSIAEQYKELNGVHSKQFHPYHSSPAPFSALLLIILMSLIDSLQLPYLLGDING